MTWHKAILAKKEQLAQYQELKKRYKAEGNQKQLKKTEGQIVKIKAQIKEMSKKLN